MGRDSTKEQASEQPIKRALLKEKRSCLFTSTELESVSLGHVGLARRTELSLHGAESFAKKSDGQ